MLFKMWTWHSHNIQKSWTINHKSLVSILFQNTQRSIGTDDSHFLFVGNSIICKSCEFLMSRRIKCCWHNEHSCLTENFQLAFCNVYLKCQFFSVMYWSKVCISSILKFAFWNILASPVYYVHRYFAFVTSRGKGWNFSCILFCTLSMCMLWVISSACTLLSHL